PSRSTSLCVLTLCSPSLFFFASSGHPRDLPSFPTRRSPISRRVRLGVLPHDGGLRLREARAARRPCRGCAREPAGGAGGVQEHRSEEHTSELQSRENLVCRLLLEKKKDQRQQRADARTRRDR